MYTCMQMVYYVDRDRRVPHLSGLDKKSKVIPWSLDKAGFVHSTQYQVVCKIIIDVDDTYLHTFNHWRCTIILLCLLYIAGCGGPIHYIHYIHHIPVVTWIYIYTYLMKPSQLNVSMFFFNPSIKCLTLSCFAPCV